MSALALPAGFGYVAGTVFSSYLVHHVYMAGGVMAARKKFGVKYPALYATEKEVPDEANRKGFNCVQRAHQNSLENLPTFYALLLTTGLQFPVTAAAAGVVYLLGRIMYFQGYSTGRPDGRYRGAFMYLGSLVHLGMLGKMLYSAVAASA